MRTLIAITCLVAAVGAACGGDDQSDAETSAPSTAAPATLNVDSGPPSFDPARHTVPGLHDIAMSADGNVREYSLLVPDTYDPAKPASLVVAFHGWTMTPDQMTKGAWGLLANEFGFLVAAPVGIDRAWAVAHDAAYAGTALPDSSADLAEFPMGDADVSFASRVIAEVNEYFLVDPNRIFVTGVSLGGFMASRVACELDGIAALGATYNSVLYTQPCRTGSTPAVMSVGHELDSTHAVSDAERAVAAWAEHNGCGAESTDTQVRERVVRSDYDQCGPGAVVAMIINEYSWGGDTAERTLWEFFDSLP